MTSSSDHPPTLGKRIAIYRWNFYYPVIGLIVVTVLGWIMVLGLTASSITGTLLFVGTNYYLLWIFHPRIVIYENGFSRRAAEIIHNCYWHEIHFIRDFTNTHGQIDQLAVSLGLPLQIVISNHFNRFGHLCQSIFQHYFDSQLESHLTQLRDGGSIRFGKVVLTAEVVHAEIEQIPVSAIEKIRFEPEDCVRFGVRSENEDDLRWINLSEDGIPNRRLFRQLIENLRGNPVKEVRTTIPADEIHEAIDLEIPAQTYRTGATSRQLGIVLLLVFILLLGVVSMTAESFGALVLMTLSLFVGVWSLVNYYLLMRPIIITLDPVGISLHTKSISKRLKWTDISEIYDQRDLSSAGSDMLLVSNAGVWFEIPPYLVKRDELIEHIHKIFSDLHLPASIRALDNGETLTFGPCTISRTMLRINERSFEIDDLGSVEIDSQGAMIVHVETKQESRQYSTSERIPNRHLLIDIIYHLQMRAESSVVFPSERLQLDENDEPMIITNFESTETLENAK